MSNLQPMLLCVFIATLLSTFTLTTVVAVPDNPNSFCISENGVSIINQCLLQEPGALTVVAQFIAQWLNPRILAIEAVVILLILPALQLSKVKSSHVAPALRKFLQNKLSIINFIHRICYSLVLCVALYSIFRQYRPCRCTTDGGQTYQHLHSIYGMPSGDAMAGGLFGAFLFDTAPFHPVITRVIGIASIVLVNAERVVLGYHTIAQVTTGSLLGVALHFYSTRMPQFMIFIDALVQIVAGAVLLQLDPALIYNYNDTNNLFSWYIWGVSFQIFVVLLAARFYFNQNHFKKLVYSLYQIETSSDKIAPREELCLMSGETDKIDKVLNGQTDVLRISDSIYTFAAFSVFLVINLMSSIITQEGWLTRIRSTA